MDYLSCDHCGDEAVSSKTDLFAEGDADRCQVCGFPGRISVDDFEEPYTATFILDEFDDSRCNDPDCTDCLDVPVKEKR